MAKMMSKSQTIAHLAEKSELSKKQMAAIFDEIMGAIERVRRDGFGVRQSVAQGDAEPCGGDAVGESRREHAAETDAGLGGVAGGVEGVAVFNNGPRKGGHPQVIGTLRRLPEVPAICWIEAAARTAGQDPVRKGMTIAPLLRLTGGTR